MRDPKRIPKILKRLQKIWEKYPDMRLGQLIENVYYNIPDPKSKWSKYNKSAYYVEDEEFISALEQLYGKGE